MGNNIVNYQVDTFPTSEKFQVFRVWGDVIWEIISPRAYYLDGSGFDYLYLDFIDPVTADIICEVLNEAEEDLNGQL